MKHSEKIAPVAARLVSAFLGFHLKIRENQWLKLLMDFNAPYPIHNYQFFLALVPAQIRPNPAESNQIKPDQTMPPPVFFIHVQRRVGRARRRPPPKYPMR